MSYETLGQLSALGWAGLVLIQVAAVPQIIKIFKEHRTAGISLPMYFILWIGLFLSLCYAIQVGDLVFIVSNSVSFVCCGVMVFSCIYMRKKYGVF